MQIKFRVCYTKHTDQIVAQAELLNQWANSCKEQQIKFIKETRLKFNIYDLLDYPDQEVLKKEYAAYLAIFNSNLSEENINYYLKGFSEAYYLMELVITPEDYE